MFFQVKVSKFGKGVLATHLLTQVNASRECDFIKIGHGCL